MQPPHRLAIAGAPILSHDRSRILARWKSDITVREPRTGAHEAPRTFSWVPRYRPSLITTEDTEDAFLAADRCTVRLVFSSPVTQVWEFEGRDTPETDEDWNRIFLAPGCFIHGDEPEQKFARIAAAAQTLLDTTDDSRMNTPRDWREFTTHLRDLNHWLARR